MKIFLVKNSSGGVSQTGHEYPQVLTLDPHTKSETFPKYSLLVRQQQLPLFNRALETWLKTTIYLARILQQFRLRVAGQFFLTWLGSISHASAIIWQCGFDIVQVLQLVFALCWKNWADITLAAMVSQLQHACLLLYTEQRQCQGHKKEVEACKDFLNLALRPGIHFYQILLPNTNHTAHLHARRGEIDSSS